MIKNSSNKKLVKLHVNSFTCKILTKEFGSVIQINKRHILFPFITSARNYSSSEDFDHHIVIQVNSNLKIFNPGIYLKRYCSNKLNEFVATLNSFGQMEAYNAIRLFYSYYGLTEDDLAMESAYKSYQRYQAEKNDKEMKKKHLESVLVNSSKYSIAELEAILALFTTKHLDKHIGVSNRFKRKLISQSRLYIYNTIGQLSVSKISQLTSIPVKTIYTSLERYQHKVVIQKKFPFPSEDLLKTCKKTAV